MSSQWKYRIDPVYGCWLWTGRTDRDGYGVVWRGRKASKAYRELYEAHRGKAPEGKALDHVCRRRACVNPAHLEPVSKRENNRRQRWAYRVKTRQCSKGHDIYAHGRRTPEGGMVCLACAQPIGKGGVSPGPRPPVILRGAGQT